MIRCYEIRDDRYRIAFMGGRESRTYIASTYLMDSYSEFKISIWSFLYSFIFRRSGYNLVIADLPRVFNVLLLRKFFYIIPTAVGCSVSLQHGINVQSFSSTFRKDIRHIESLPYSFRSSQSDDDLKMFFDKFYLPYMKNRHGAAQLYYDLKDLKQLLSRGELIFAIRDDDIIGGVIFTNNGMIPEMRMVAISTDSNLSSDDKRYLITALYLRCVEMFCAQGFREFSFGWNRPFAYDGVFQSKRKWRLYITKCTNWCYFIKANILAMDTRQLLSKHPFFFELSGKYNLAMFDMDHSEDDRRLKIEGINEIWHYRYDNEKQQYDIDRHPRNITIVNGDRDSESTSAIN